MLTDAEKHEAIEAIALAITLNEPEQVIERLRNLCRKKSARADDRWSNAAAALTEALATVVFGELNEPKTKPDDSEPQAA